MSRPSWARWVTRISLVIALVALVLTIRDTGLATIGRYFKRIGWWWFAVIALEVVITWLDPVAIRAFMSPEQHKVRLRAAQHRVALRPAAPRHPAGLVDHAGTRGGQLAEAVKVSVLTEHVSQTRAVA